MSNAEICSLRFLGLGVLALCFAGAASADFSIRRSAVGNGAGATGDGSVGIVGTVGQPGIGLTSGVSYSACFGFWSLQKITVATDVPESSPPTEERTRLDQNAPNPFNPTTTISFFIAEKGKVTLKVYDLAGREVVTLVDKEMDTGSYSVVLRPNMASGVYFYRLQTTSDTLSRRMILLK